MLYTLQAALLCNILSGNTIIDILCVLWLPLMPVCYKIMWTEVRKDSKGGKCSPSNPSSVFALTDSPGGYIFKRLTFMFVMFILVLSFPSLKGGPWAEDLHIFPALSSRDLGVKGTLVLLEQVLAAQFVIQNRSTARLRWADREGVWHSRSSVGFSRILTARCHSAQTFSPLEYLLLQLLRDWHFRICVRDPTVPLSLQFKRWWSTANIQVWEGEVSGQA